MNARGEKIKAKQKNQVENRAINRTNSAVITMYQQSRRFSRIDLQVTFITVMP